MTATDGIVIPKILEALPHRFPWVLVDRVTELVPQQRIRGYKLVSHNEPWVPGHFPEYPILPGVLVIEALAQLSGILAHGSVSAEFSSAQPLLLGIDKAKFRRPVVPGDRLDLAVQLLQHRAQTWRLRGEAHVEGTLCAEAELLTSITTLVASR